MNASFNSFFHPQRELPLGVTLPDKALFTVKEAQAHLGLGKTSIYALIKDGLLEVKHPTPRSTRITRESLAAHLERAGSREAVRAAMAEAQARKVAQEQHAQAVQAQQQEQKKEGLLARWGLGKRK